MSSYLGGLYMSGGLCTLSGYFVLATLYKKADFLSRFHPLFIHSVVLWFVGRVSVFLSPVGPAGELYPMFCLTLLVFFFTLSMLALYRKTTSRKAVIQPVQHRNGR